MSCGLPASLAASQPYELRLLTALQGNWTPPQSASREEVGSAQRSGVGPESANLSFTPLGCEANPLRSHVTRCPDCRHYSGWGALARIIQRRPTRVTKCQVQAGLVSVGLGLFHEPRHYFLLHVPFPSKVPTLYVACPGASATPCPADHEPCQSHSRPTSWRAARSSGPAPANRASPPRQPALLLPS